MDALYPLLSIAILCGIVWFVVTEPGRAKRRRAIRVQRAYSNHVAACERDGIPPWDADKIWAAYNMADGVR